ncbi:MAG: ZIP family metal transporter, partial [Candidatus Gracilibacteria bacterium]|nr:ZIP family metal transporter [Candidatus Gracilibacteria bacterium]
MNFTNFFYALLASFIVSLISLIGIITIGFKIEKLKKILIYFVGFSTGALFGDVFIHLLPEFYEKNGTNIMGSIFILSGILAFFIIEKIIHWRHCHEMGCEEHNHNLAKINLIGDGFHNLIDGIIIGGSFLVDTQVGIATTIAVLLHEIPQELGDFGILLHSGLSFKKALFYNFLSAIVAVFGTILAFLLA